MRANLFLAILASGFVASLPVGKDEVPGLTPAELEGPATKAKPIDLATLQREDLPDHLGPVITDVTNHNQHVGSSLIPDNQGTVARQVQDVTSRRATAIGELPEHLQGAAEELIPKVVDPFAFEV